MFPFQYAFQHLPFDLNLCVVEKEESLKWELFLKSIWIILTSPSWSWSHVQLHPHRQLCREPTRQDGAQNENSFPYVLEEA